MPANDDELTNSSGSGTIQTGPAGVQRVKERARAYVHPVTGEENLPTPPLQSEDT